LQCPNQYLTGFHDICKVVSILPPRCWRQQIGWSYCATSQTFGLVVWRNTKKKVTLSRTCCPGRVVMVRCYGCFANGLRFDSPYRLSYCIFLCFIPGSA